MFKGAKKFSPQKFYIDELRGKRKRRRKRIAFLVIFSLLGLLVFSAYAFLFSGWFSIKRISVSGNKEISKEEIKNLANEHLSKPYLFGYIRPFANILFANSESIEHSLGENFPIIDEVDVNKHLFGRYLTIEIGEREPAGIWCPEEGSGGCFYFDKNLVLFEPAPRFSGQVYLVIEDGRGKGFELSDRFDDKELFDKIFETKEILDQLEILEYSNFYLPENSFEFWIKNEEGWYVYLDKETNITAQLVALKKFLEEKLPPTRRQTLEYIDLRVNNRIYYK